MSTDCDLASQTTRLLLFGLYKGLGAASSEAVDMTCPPFCGRVSCVHYPVNHSLSPLCSNTADFGRSSCATTCMCEEKQPSRTCRQNTHTHTNTSGKEVFHIEAGESELEKKHHYDSNLILLNAHYSTSCCVCYNFLKFF